MEKMANIFSFKTPRKIRITPEILTIAAILLIGLFVRIYNIESYVLFLGDEGRDALVVWEILHGNLTLLGPTSSVGGFFLGPIYYYLMAPFLWLSNYDPVGPSYMVVLLGVATIFLVYKLGKVFFGSVAGLSASFLYAISPIVIIYSRSSWNPNVFPFFTLSSLYVLYFAVKRNKWWLFAFSGFLMGVNLQIHYLATFVGAIMFLYVTFVDLERKKKYIKILSARYLYMILGFIVGFSPFIAFEVRHSFTNTLNIIKFIFNSSDTGFAGNIFMNVKIVFDRLFGGLLFSFPSHQGQGLYDPTIISIWYGITIFIGFFLLGFFLFYFYKNFKKKVEFQKLFLIFIWIFVGIGLFLFYKKSVYDYYLGFLYPLPFILLGLVFEKIVNNYKKVGLAVVMLLIGLFAIFSIKFTPLSVPGNYQVNQVRLASEFILDKTNGEPFNFALSGDGNSDHAYRYFFRLADQDPVRILGVGEDPERKSVTKQLFVICEQPPCRPLGESSNDIAGFGRAEIADEWNVSVLRVYKLIHYTGPEEE